MEIKQGQHLNEQEQEVQAYFNTEILKNINFAVGENQTCTELDLFKRPSKWVINSLTVEAEYYTQDENYTFKQFLIYGTI